MFMCRVYKCMLITSNLSPTFLVKDPSTEILGWRSI